MKKYSKFKIFNSKFSRGAYLPVVMMVSVLFMSLSVAVVTLSLSNLKIAKNHERTVSAVEVAEAGVNYYMWHLSHNNKDYCDGETCTGAGPYGPYPHVYKDIAGNVLGKYEITIAPPTLGDSITTVTSRGIVGSSERTVVAELGMPSFARFAFVTDNECWFGDNETSNGPVHSNVGVHFDGVANGVVSSSAETYTPTYNFGGDGQLHDGVWGSGGPKNFWVFPVPKVDFNRVSIDFLNLKTQSDLAGIHLTSSNSLGYYLKLRADGKIDVYRVSRERSTGITTNFLQTRNAPSNGVVYVEDNVWIDGTWPSQITVAAHTPGNGTPIIKIKDNLLYSTKDGSASIGLVAEGNIEVPEYSVQNLQINAALLSKTGHVWFPDVPGYVKNSISVYGSIASFQYWTWTWVSGSTTVSGFKSTTQTFDPYLTLTPPPQFPTTGSYMILNWREE